MLYSYTGEKMYSVEKEINKLYNSGYTFFLNPKELQNVVSHLKKNSYNVYKPSKYAEKAIIYIKDKPSIILYEIKTAILLRHQDILGSLFSLKINDNLFGDIIIMNNHYYFYTFEKMRTFFEMEFTKIGNSKIELIERNIDLLNDYEPYFESIKIITSSLRIDAVISKIIHTNRENVKKLIKDKQVVYNYEILTSGNKILKIEDVFSIRKYGKYKFDKIIASTKKDNLIIKVLKYSIEKHLM